MIVSEFQDGRKALCFEYKNVTSLEDANVWYVAIQCWWYSFGAISESVIHLPLMSKEDLHRHDYNKFSHQFTIFICIDSGLDVHSGESIGNARCAIMFSCTMLRKCVKMLVIMVFGVLNSVFPSLTLYILHCRSFIEYWSIKLWSSFGCVEF